ncbi:MAG: pyruvate kinase [Cardiobacteriaceae bacterium]|nr:pyruvate kinase [Cardiobacteriaceae bacterium]
MSKNRDLKRISHHTKIIATLGPASSDIETLEHMIRIGLNVVRFNFSHGDLAFHESNAEKVREASRRAGREIAIMADLQGPKIRVGAIKGGSMTLEEGDRLILDADFQGEGENLHVGLDYKELPNDVKKGDVLLIDDGFITVVVDEVIQNQVVTIVQNSGILKSKKGINKQGGGLSAPALTEKDYRDLEIALKIGADYIAVSFVKSAADMQLAKQLIKASPHAGSILPGVVAKIERVEAIENLDEIVAASDGVMVARGDLAVEVGNAAVPALQKRIIKTARKHNCFSITATQMMESMISSPVPTRAEVSDVANAVMDGTDAVMLSAETAVGKYPFETVRQMALICAAAEDTRETFRLKRFDEIPTSRVDQAIAASAVIAAANVNAKAIVVFTNSGTTALHLSRYNINLPVHALTTSIEVQRKMSMYRGVRPARLDTSKDLNSAIAQAEAYMLEREHLKSGDLYVITNGSTMGVTGNTNSLHINRAK